MESKIVGSEPFFSIQIIEVEEYECPCCGETTYTRITQLNNWSERRDIIDQETYLQIIDEKELSLLN